MTESSNNSLLARVDLVCDRFEQAWLANDDGANNDVPDLESYLDLWQGPERGVLFEHLLELDVDYRRRRGLPCGADHYRTRFPEYLAAIQNANFDTRPDPGATEIAPPPKHVPYAPPSDADLPDTAPWGGHDAQRGRYAPGTVVAERYRVVDLLGRGGMGEVYRADDLKLGHAVALKFLPEEIASDPQRLEYFLNEARLSRQISHPNVCRVYDIGDVAGTVFLSMEFIDGEDLRVLLKRFGRFPPEKATQLALQMCAGLAAAHDVGVLHRDLKPANVMVDQRGRAKIADFGVARLADDRDATGRLIGTPAYMAPEQLLHNRTSPQSDLYALGLVFYEMFTGQRPYQAETIGDLIEKQSQGPPPDARSVVPELDPAVSAAITACLAQTPESRPQTALELARRLPGADPLAIALAAGHTPSPEQVAYAGKDRVLSPRAALACYVGSLAALIVVVLLATRMMQNLGLSESPRVLASRARDHLAELGYSAKPRDEAWGFDVDTAYLEYVREHPEHWANLPDAGPAAVYFWYRQSPQPLVPHRADWTGDRFLEVDQIRPPLTEPGMVRLRTDSDGTLLQFEAIAPDAQLLSETLAPSTEDNVRNSATPVNSETSAVDTWPLLLDWAQASEPVSEGKLQPAPPTERPHAFANQLAAWSGTGLFSSWPDESATIEMAALDGTPVMVQTTGPWSLNSRSTAQRFSGEHPVRSAMLLLWIPSLMLVAVILAVRNVRLGRGDRRGAMRVAAFVFITGMISWILRDTHVATSAELDLLFTALAGSCLISATVGTSYLALESYLRRLWPQCILGWSRLLTGRIRDAAVGRELLVGVLVGTLAAAFKLLIVLAPAPHGLPTDAPIILNFNTLLGTRVAAGEIAVAACMALLYATFNHLVLLFALRLILRDMRLASVVFVAFLTLFVAVQFRAWHVAVLLTATEMSLTVLLLVRFGLLSAIAMHFTRLLLKWPLTVDFSAWYADISLFALVAAIGLASWAFWTALDGRSLAPQSDSVLGTHTS